MKVESVSIQGFKVFDDLTVSFKHKTLQEVSSRFLVLGDNGTGKTTLLQAIALPLAIATHQIRSVAEFDWIGFVPGRYARWGQPRIELIVSFADEEIRATREVARRWYEAQSPDFKASHPYVERGDSETVHLTLDGGNCHAGSMAEFLQFQGRYNAMALLRTDPAARDYFDQLPGLFWFDQYRNLGTGPQPENGDGAVTNRGRTSYETGIGRLRRYLSGWALAQQSRSIPYRTNYLMELENLFRRVFQDRSFAGVEPMPGVDSPTPEDFYFLLNDGHRYYDIVEMSAGEQAVFPILYEFVRQQIAYSVVLIDEIDLNLHPPAAQTLVTQLTKIGPTCQFIFTTHAEAVSNIIGEDETFRLPGGALCL
jgi:predicted ATPase